MQEEWQGTRQRGGEEKQLSHLYGSAQLKILKALKPNLAKVKPYLRQAPPTPYVIYLDWFTAHTHPLPDLDNIDETQECFTPQINVNLL